MEIGQPFIVCDNLVKIFRVVEHDVVALQGLDMVVAPGELMGIVGVSGSGKSTLLNLTSGIDRADSGQVIIANTDITRLSEHDRTIFRRDHIGIIFDQLVRDIQLKPSRKKS